MSNYDMTQDRVIHRAAADTDCTILILSGKAIALVEDGDEECIGYYQPIREGQYVHNQYEGYSYYVEDGALRSVHGRPSDMQELTVNDGNQQIADRGEDVAELVGDERSHETQNNYPTLTQSQLDAIAVSMDEAIREDLHSAAEWQHPGEFLTAYLARDPEFPISQFATGQ